MKVIIVKGTYHKNGMTSFLVDEFVKGIKSIHSNTKINIFDLLDKKVNFCTGCIACSKDKSLEIGKCPFKDDATKIFPEMVKADVVVFATPLYDFGPTALMKKFMERAVCMSYWDPYPKPRVKKIKSKHGVVILSSACPSPLNDLSLMTLYPRVVLSSVYARFFGCNKKHVLAAGGMMYSPKIKDKWMKKSYNLGIKIAKKLSKKSD